MSSGDRAAEGTKSVFSAIGDTGETIRNSINNFADELASGVKSPGGPSAAHPTADTHTLGEGTHDRSGITNSTTSSGDIHPDVKALGTEVGKGVNAAGDKIDEMRHKQQ